MMLWYYGIMVLWYYFINIGSMSTTSITIAIIWWWAAGMMTAATIALRDDIDAEITIFEKNTKLGAKVIISGWGRCNLTTGYYRSRDLLPHYTRGADFAKKLFKRYSPKKIRQRFEDRGIKTKEESDHRVFPVSDDGHEVVKMFENLFQERGVNVHFKEWVKSMTHSGAWFAIITDQDTYHFDRVVVATGGSAFSHTGSTGDGYAFARMLGHRVTPLGPSLNSFLTAEQYLHRLSGVAFAHGGLRRGDGSCEWPVLLTHFGLSGPVVFILASQTAFEKIDTNHPLPIYFQPDATKNQQQWEQILLDEAADHPRKMIATILSWHLPKRFVEVMIEQSWIAKKTSIGVLRRNERLKVSLLLGEGLPLHLIGRRPGDEFVTAGGVVREEIDPSTMASRLVWWLYFAGEVVDVDGVTWWYNLQRCRASAAVVGESIH